MCADFYFAVLEPTIDNEEFRAKIKTLQYELDSMKQERDYANMRHEKDLRNVALKAEETFKKAQVGRYSHFTFHTSES